MNCHRCGRPLSNPKSVERKYGPVCWKKIPKETKFEPMFKNKKPKFVNVKEFKKRLDEIDEAIKKKKLPKNPLVL